MVYKITQYRKVNNLIVSQFYLKANFDCNLSFFIRDVIVILKTWSKFLNDHVNIYFLLFFQNRLPKALWSNKNFANFKNFTGQRPVSNDFIVSKANNCKQQTHHFNKTPP